MADTNECNDTIHNNPFLTAQRVGCPTLVSRSTALTRRDYTSVPWRSTRRQLDHQLEDSPPNAFDTSLLSGASSDASKSIRIFARIPSVSIGSQHNATSRRSIYNINYHQSATASLHSPIHDSQTILDGILPGQPNHPYLPIHGMCNIEPILQQDPTNAHVYALIKYIQKIARIVNRIITVHATCIPSSHAALKIVQSCFI
jgi:hypothetical protein